MTERRLPQTWSQEMLAFCKEDPEFSASLTREERRLFKTRRRDSDLLWSIAAKLRERAAYLKENAGSH